MATPVTFKIEIDFVGDGRWAPYKEIEVPSGGYAHHEFPKGFSAHWVRITANRECNATVYFMYT